LLRALLTYRSYLTAAIFLVAVGVTGCGQESSDNGSDSPPVDLQTTSYPYHPDTREPPANDLDWSVCPLNSDDTSFASGVAECADLDVPVRREAAADGRTLSVFVKRYRPVSAPRGQLWLISGGPGSSGADFEAVIDLFLRLGPDLEIYMPDHRGTGRSDRLSCPVEEDPDSLSGSAIVGAEWQSCSSAVTEQWGSDLAGFSTTEAAGDLGELIDRTYHPGDEIYLYGVSYGTYLVERYLQLYPDQATGVVLDSICSPGSCDLLLGYDRGFNTTAQALFQLCAEDPSCASQFDTDPWSAAVTALSQLDMGYCSSLGWDRTTARNVLGIMLIYAQLRDYMPAVIKRLTRCSDNDVAALSHLLGVLSSLAGDDPFFSQPLSTNIALSELISSPKPTAAEVRANVTDLVASIDAGPANADAIDVWPIYEPDGYFGQYAETSVPMLMLNGDLDPQTPLRVAQPMGDHFQGPNQNFLVIPYSPHTTLTQSYVDEDGNTCGADLAGQFFADPAKTLDLTCLSEVEPPNFWGYPDLTPVIFQTESAWADEAPISAASASVSAQLQRLRSQVLGASGARHRP